MRLATIKKSNETLKKKFWLYREKEKKRHRKNSRKKEIMRHVEKMLPSSNMIQALHNSVGRRGMMIRPAIQLIIKVFEIWFSKKAEDIINLTGILLSNEDSYAFIGKFLKVMLIQNGFMKSSIFQKNDPKILKDFWLSGPKSFKFFCVIFWKLIVSYISFILT